MTRERDRQIELSGRLFELFGGRRPRDVMADGDYTELCAQHAGDAWFDRERNRVEDIALALDHRLDELEPYEQVEEALRSFYELRDEPRRQAICQELTLRRFAGSWSDPQVDYYEQAREKLATWHDYFLSFTNHNPMPGYVMQVNVDHKRLIRKAFDKKPFTLDERCNENLLARLIRIRLCHESLVGKYFPDQRGQGKVQPELMTAARRSFAFIQLLQNTIFESSPNYCKLEFEAATEDESRMLIFVLPTRLKEFIPKSALASGMHAWHDTITRYDVVEIEPATTKEMAQTALDLIVKRVVEPVKSAREQVFENVPE